MLISCTNLQADNLNVWVMGPELGEFIAGIRNEDDQQCVTGETRWLYASRASVWKSDDRSLAVKCYEPEGKIRVINLFFTLLNNVKHFADDINTLVFGAKKKTTERPRTSLRPTTTTRRPSRTTTARPRSSECRQTFWRPCARTCEVLLFIFH